MKSIRIFAAAAVLLMTVACGSNTKAQGGLDANAPSKGKIDSVSYYLGINYGQMLKQYEFGDLNYSQMISGMKDFLAAKGNYDDEDFVKQFKLNPEMMNDCINDYLAQQNAYTAALRSAEAEKFFSENAKKSGVQQSETGLQYIIEAAGNENRPGPMDTVYVHYKGTLLDGTVFDQTSEDSEPIALTLNRVIPAWTEGIQLVGEGGKIKLFVPADLGYGPRAMGSIPANSTLIFDVTVDSVKHYSMDSE